MPAPTSATERAYAHVRDAILSGATAGGELLTEGEVAQAVGVSRTPVREAMLRLQAEGMLRLYPKRGALVVPVTAAEAADLFEARRLVETWAAERVSGDLDLADTMERELDAMREHRTAGDVGAFTAADRTFHELMVAAAGNEILTRLYRSLRARQICLTVALMRVSAARMDHAVADHARFVELIRADRRDALVALTRAHLDHAAAQARGAS